ncbi:MAG: type II toxin-antitoxin system PemK/MazF family toxin [Stellaceae bacterium]
MTTKDLTRGDIVVVADRAAEGGGKPRPAIILQRSEALAELATVTVVFLTSTAREAPAVPATPVTGLRVPSWAMIERLATVRKARIGRRIGQTDNVTLTHIGRALAVFLGLA